MVVFFGVGFNVTSFGNTIIETLRLSIVLRMVIVSICGICFGLEISS